MAYSIWAAMFGSGLQQNVMAGLLPEELPGGTVQNDNKNPMWKQNLEILQSSTLASDVLPMLLGKSQKVCLFKKQAIICLCL
jgi:hypothetical protein